MSRLPGAASPASIRLSLALAALSIALVPVVPAAAATSKTVNVLAATYSPARFSVPAGSTIVFKNTSQFPHTATADNGSFDTGLIAPGASESIVVKKAGKIAFHCQFHGGAGGVGQSGSVTITAAAAASPRPSTSAGGPRSTPPASDSTSALPAFGDDLPWLLFLAAGIGSVMLAVVVDALRSGHGWRRA